MHVCGCVWVCRCQEARRRTAHTQKRCTDLSRNPLYSFVSVYHSNVLSQETRGVKPGALCVPSLEEKVFDDNIDGELSMTGEW